MFRADPTDIVKTNRLAITGLLALSVAALIVTIWIMVEFLREQEIVLALIKQLPTDARATAEQLAGELRWQFRLTALVVLNLVVTAFAVILLWRAYRISQESLRDIKALAGDILSSMGQAVITTDIDGIVTSINRKGVELLSISQEAVGQPLASLSEAIPLEKFREQGRIESPSQFSKDYSFLNNGISYTFRAYCQPLRNHEETDIGNVVQLRDVSERVLMDDRLRRMERYMGLGSLAAGLHHEIKNPLAALSLHVQLLEEEMVARETSDEVHEMLSVIKIEINRIGGVLENFRDFASLENLNCSDVDPTELVEQQLKLIRPRAEQRGIELQTHIVVGKPIVVQVDRVRLEQVLLNLFINAMEAMTKGGTLTVHLAQVEKAMGIFVSIVVADDGCGIPESVRGRIFDPYFTTKSSGTGMGLAICDKIIRQHHGTLEYRAVDAGTVLEILLPVESVPQSDTREPND